MLQTHALRLPIKTASAHHSAILKSRFRVSVKASLVLVQSHHLKQLFWWPLQMAALWKPEPEKNNTKRSVFQTVYCSTSLLRLQQLIREKWQ